VKPSGNETINEILTVYLRKRRAFSHTTAGSVVRKLFGMTSLKDNILEK